MRTDFSGIATNDREWYFFTQQERKHQNRNSMNRATKAGYWKSTGNDQEIYSGESLIGMKKILVFHIGRTSKGEGTRWVMHEYRTTLKEYDGTKPGQKAVVLCRLFEKKETKKKLKAAPAHVSPALEVQAQTHQTSNPSCDSEMSNAMMCDATAPVECNNDHNAYVAENQVAEVKSSEVDEHLKENVKMFFVPYPEEQDNLFPAPSLPPISPVVSTPFKVNSSHEETQSEPTPASQALWEQVEKHPINAYAADNQVAEAKATEMQLELVSSRCIFCPVTNDLNSGHCGHPQYDTNENWGLLPNATDDEPLEKMVSVKDIGSDARLANAQRPFVDSRLFKKQDESIEVPNHDVAEPAVLSRTTAKSSPEDTQAELAPELVSKLLGWKAENDPTSVEYFIAEASDGSTSDTVAPVNYNNSNSYGVENKVGELPAPEPDPELAGTLDMLCEQQLFSPIHAQMQAELGYSGIYFLAHNDFNSGNNGVQFPHGSNESDDTSEVLESILGNTEECSYDESDNQNILAYDGQTSMKTEVVNELLQSKEIINRKPHLQMETTPLQNPVSSGGGAEQIYDFSLKELNNHLSAFASGEVRNESMTQMAQGTAPRRSLLQRKHQVRSLTTSLMSEDCSYTTEDHELKPVATEEEKASEKHAVASGHGAAASALSEHRKILSDSPENCKTPQEPNTSMRPSLKLQGNILTGINFGSLFSKAPPVRHSNWPLALLFRVVVIAVLFIIFASIWRCLKF